MHDFDVIVVGAGVVGTAVARSLLTRKAAKTVAVIEKEGAPAMHTSGRNSGVVHAGFNPKPGGLKAKFCVEGNRRLTDLCKKNGLAYKPVGTLVVALDPGETPILEELYRRGRENGVPDLCIIDGNELRRLEPNAFGVAALHAPSGGITSGREVTITLAKEAENAGCRFLFGHKVVAIEPNSTKINVRTSYATLRCERLVNCAGLYADEVAHKMGVGMDYTIVPFRGEYYQLKSEKSGLVNSMLYPVPDLNYPFLGVHWTKTIKGDLILGPNATMALGRESYSPFNVDLLETARMMGKPAFWKMFLSADFRRVAWEQFLISMSRSRFVKEAQKLVPDLKPSDVVKGKSGNRPQLVDREGRLVEDILIEKQGNSVHVLNAVSPGFTCSLPFADYVVDTLTQ